MSGAMAFLAGMGAGYMTQKQRNLENDRLAKIDTQNQQLFQAKIDEINQNKAEKAALQAAGAPQEVTPEQGPPTEAQYAATPAGQEPDAIGYRVGNGIGAKDFATRGLADTAATQQNTPQARRTRMADLAAQGNTFASTALTNDMQREASQMTINKGHREEANQVFDHGVKTALQTGGPQAMADFMSNSPADGQGGAIKFKAVISPDGKSWQMNRVGDDGSITPFSQSFSNDEGGMAIAGMMLSRAVPDSEKVKHLMAEKEAQLKGGKEAREALEGKSRASYYDAYAEALRPGGTKDRSAGAKKADHFDDKQWDAAAKIDKSVVSLPNADLGKDTESGDLRSAYLKTFNAARAGGDMAPNEAVEYATSTIVKLKNAAQARVDQARAADKNSTLTVDQAVKGIIREAASFKSSQPAPTPSSTRVTPQQQQANDSDRPLILASELKSAQARLAAGDPRANADIDALNNEIARLPRGSGRPAAPTPRTIAATRAVAPVVAAPVLAPSAPALATRGVQASVPSYDQWLQAKNARDQLISNANQMTPENRDNYLRNRLPQIEQAIEFNQNYKKY